MPANTAPTFLLTPNLGTPVALTTQQTSFTDSTSMALIFTAGSNGSMLRRVRARAVGTNVASVLRIFLNAGSGTAITLFDEVSLPATTASSVAGLQPIAMPVGLVLPAGWRVYAAIGTTVAAGWHVTPVGGDY